MSVELTGTRTQWFRLDNVSNETINFVSSAVFKIEKGGCIYTQNVSNSTYNLDGTLRMYNTYSRTNGVDAYGSGNVFNIGSSFQFFQDNPSGDIAAIYVHGSNNVINNYAQLTDYQEDIRVSSQNSKLNNYGLISKLEMSTDMTVYNEGRLGHVVVRDIIRLDYPTVVINAGEWGGLNNSGSLTVLNAFEGSNFAETIINKGHLYADVLLGGGDDRFENDGGNMSGIVYGGAGDDSFVFDRGVLRGLAGPMPGSYEIVERAGEGTDTLIVTSDYLQYETSTVQLVDNVENVVLQGTVAGTVRGNALDNTMTGNNGDNVLQGGGGNDTLKGGFGTDTAVFSGKKADYTYIKNGDGSWTVTDKRFGAIDGADILVGMEKLQFSDVVVDLNAVSNARPVITSNGGGSTATIKIAEGNTTVTTVKATDPEKATIVYSLAGGADASFFSINSKTGALIFKSAPDFEAPKDAGKNNVYDVIVKASDGQLNDTQALKITVTDVGAMKLNGTSFADIMTGSSENDVIRGNGGNDTLSGVGGNDLLYGGEGKDTLNGGQGNDKLYGGLHADTLTGGSGNDVFVFDTKIGSSNIDRITDFSVANDTIWLDDDVFTKAGKVGTLTSSAFWAGSKAHDTSDRIIYDKASGKLWYDADGSGSSAAVQIALLNKDLALTAQDFYIIA